MLNKIKLYGDLADFIGYKELEAVINSTSDALRFLICNFPKVEAYMSTRYYKVLVNNEEISKEEINYPIGKGEISIDPVISGSCSNTSKIIVGAILIGAAIAFPGASLGYGGFTAVKGYSAFQATVGNIGILLALSGTSGILFPQQELEDFENDQDPRISFSFNGVQNTSRAGTSVPIVYGEIITGSVVISAGIDTDQVHA